MNPSISAVVPTFRDTEGLVSTVRSLLPQLSAADELIVVDNGPASEHASVEAALAGLHRPVLLHCAHPGSYAARNAGVARSTGRVVAFTDAGCVVSPTWFEAIRAHFTGSDRPRVSGPITFTFPGGRPTLSATVDERLHLRQDRYVRDGWAATANMAMTRKAFDAAGGFDTRLLSGGDYEFGIRCMALGLPIAWSDSMAIEHEARSSLGEVLRKRRRVLRGLHELRACAAFRGNLSAAQSAGTLQTRTERRSAPALASAPAVLAYLLYRVVRLHDRLYRSRLRRTAAMTPERHPARA